MMKSEQSQSLSLQERMAAAMAEVELALVEARRELLGLRDKAARHGLDGDVSQVHYKFVEAERVAARARATMKGVAAPVQGRAFWELGADVYAGETEAEALAAHDGVNDAREYRKQALLDGKSLAAGEGRA